MMYLMDEAANNELLETKGSLYLRSNHMHYGRPTYVTGWHQSREAEPKDYDLDAIPVGKKILSHSTYRRLGDMENGDWRTTSAEHLSQIHLKKDYEVKDVSKLINEDNIDTLNIERHTGHPEHGFGAVLPHHTKEHGKIIVQILQTILQLIRNATLSLQTLQTIGDLAEIHGRMRVEFMPIIR
ncbi:cilia- and flagella-associated protein 95 isoform X2 [Pelobates fuscus]|uniref:cilia- and flagella-associated protein 95 isoform X2 n=1 Tax=Pelobates fuscus TaxID=191477 RepID=UPI002FE49A1A